MTKQTLGTRRRKFLSLCLALVMTLGLLPLNVWAGYSNNRYLNNATSDFDKIYAGRILTKDGSGDILNITLNNGKKVDWVYHRYDAGSKADKTETKTQTNNYGEKLELSHNVGADLSTAFNGTGDNYRVGDFTYPAPENSNCTLDLYTYSTVTFDLGDHAKSGATAPSAQHPLIYGTVTKPADPKGAAGWAFDGWYATREGEEGEYKWDFEDSVYNDMTLTAHWLDLSVKFYPYEEDEGGYTFVEGDYYMYVELYLGEYEGLEEAGLDGDEPTQEVTPTIYYKCAPYTPSEDEDSASSGFTVYDPEDPIRITEDTVITAYAEMGEAKGAESTATYRIAPALSVEDVKMGSLKAGNYDPEDAETGVKLTNRSSSRDLVVVGAELQGEQKDAFRLAFSADPENTKALYDGGEEKWLYLLEAGKHTTEAISVLPAEDLEAGEYSATIAVSYQLLEKPTAVEEADGMDEYREPETLVSTATVTLTVNEDDTYQLTLHANNGKKPEETKVLNSGDGSFMLPECPFTNGSKVFAGYAEEADAQFAVWYPGEEYPLSSDNDTTGDLYAIWADQLYTISGNLESYYNGSVTLILERGGIPLKTIDDKEISGADRTTSPETAGAVSYTFPGVQSGIYNLVVKQPLALKQDEEGKYYLEEDGDDVILTKTTAIVIVNANVEATVKLPLYEANSTLTVDENIPGSDAYLRQMVVAGVDQIAEQFADPSKSVDVEMKVEGSDNQTLANKAKGALSGAMAQTKVYLLGLSLTKTETPYNPQLQSSFKILTETDSYVELVMPVDPKWDTFAVYRQHEYEDGKKDDQLPLLGSKRLDVYKENGVKKEGYVYDKTAHMLYIYLNKLCDLAIACGKKDTTPTPDPDPVPVIILGDWYNIRVLETVNGAVKSDHERAKADMLITLTVKPDEGYELSELKVLDKNDKEVKLKDEGNGVYTFYMPASDVRVSSKFAAAATEPSEPSERTDCPRDNTCPMSAFDDLDRWAWYHDGVHYVLEKGIMNGMGDRVFAPDGTTTRAQVATILWNLAGKPVVNYLMSYSDVSESAWYAEAIRWASAQGVVTGYDDGRFGPDDPVTREQLAAMLYRFAKLLGKGFTGAWAFPLDYPDAADVSEWAYEPLCWMTMHGVINGMDGKLNPKGNATRAQVATMLMRFCEE